MKKTELFTFGIKLERAFHERFPKDPESIKDNEGTYGINAVLLEYLGIDNYKEFCKKFNEKNSDKPTDAYFKESFTENPQATQSILYDNKIRFYYFGMSNIIEIVQKIIS